MALSRHADQHTAISPFQVLATNRRGDTRLIGSYRHHGCAISVARRLHELSGGASVVVLDQISGAVIHDSALKVRV